MNQIDHCDRAGLLAMAGLSFEQFEQLLILIHEGTREPVPWTRLLERLRVLLQANYVSLVLRIPDQLRPMQLVFAGEAKPMLVRPYEAEYALTDPFPALSRGRVVLLEEVLDVEAWLRSAGYQAFHAALDLRYLLGADLGKGAEPSCRFRVCRPHHAEGFGVAERALCTLLLPHLAVAVDTRASLDIVEVERSCYDSMLDRLGVGVVMLDRRGRVLRLNEAAERIVAESDGLQIIGGRLAASMAAENHLLHEFIAQAVNAPGGPGHDEVHGMALSRRGGKAALELAVRATPLTQGSETAERPAVICIVRDPADRLLASEEQLRRLYGFTVAEAGLAVELMRGLSVDEAASELGVTRNTVRCQLRALFAKTGVSRQAELLRVLLSGVAPLS